MGTSLGRGGGHAQSTVDVPETVVDRARVAVVRTSPQTVVADYQRLLQISGCGRLLAGANQVVVYGNLTWGRFFPATSSPPWQLDGIATALVPKENWRWVAGTGHTGRPRRAAAANHWPGALSRHSQRFAPVSRAAGMAYPPGRTLLALDRIMPEGPPIPDSFQGTVALHLPTLKTHGELGLAGAVENAWGTWMRAGGGLAASHPHEVLVDLLLLQQSTHSAVCAVMDGTIVGDGAGPRTVEPREANVLLASTDPVALDAVAARMAGMDPFGIRYLALAYALGLGCADVDEIEMVGDDITDFDLHLHARRHPAAVTRAIFGQLNVGKLERWLFARPSMRAASNLYYDVLWYHSVGRARLASFMQSPWGAQFRSYASHRG